MTISKIISMQLLVVFLLAKSCGNNDISELGSQCCDCLEKNWIGLSEMDNNKKKEVIENCINENVEKHLSTEENSSDNYLDRLFNMSMKVSKELNSRCKVFQDNKEEIVEILSSESSTSNLNIFPDLSDFKSITGEIVGINAITKNYYEIKLKTKENEIMVFYFAPIPEEWMSNIVLIHYEVDSFKEKEILRIKMIELIN